METDVSQPMTADREKRWAAFSSVLAAIFLAGMKLIVGILTGSLGILAEALHSALDLAAAAMTFFAVRVSGRPADREHTYGHGKVENLSALFETLLLLATCVWIIVEAIQRLTVKHVEVEASVWAFIVMIVAIAVDYSRSTMLYRVARKHQSQALEADALHFSTDIWSSSVVIVGLMLVRVAEWTGWSWLAKADAVAALGVAMIVIYVSLQLGRRTIAALLDEVPASLRDQVIAAARVPGVVEVTRVRLRRSGPEAFADLTVTVNRQTAFERTHEIATRVEEAVRSILPGADVVVHLEPVADDQEGALATLQALATRMGLGVHGIRFYHQARAGDLLEMHVEVNEGLTVEQAHAQVSAFEAAVRQALPAVGQVVTHLEPIGEDGVHRSATTADEAQMRSVLESILQELALTCRPHEIAVHHAGGELHLSFHCTIAGNTAITDAHSLTEQVEALLRRRVPHLGRVVIHVEPPDASAGQEDVQPTLASDRP